MFERKRYPIGAVAAAVATLASAAWAQSLDTIDTSAIALPEPIVIQSGDRNRLRLTGNVNVAVRLSDPSLLQKLGPGARTSTRMSIDERRAYVDALAVKQSEVLARIGELGGVALARLTRTGNTVVVSVPATRLPEIARLPGVAGVLDVQDYTRHLEASVPYVGGTAVHGQGYDGAGVLVAVLDSGIDYTHAQLGGAGTIEAFNAAAGNATVVEPGTFPTAKVITGIDFVGETWPTGPLAPDPDPIDAGTDAGHGTHVADIVAGQLGMAPGASLMAVKVCSSVSTSCSGVAILQGLDWIADPNGDLDFSDAPHIINMSLGGAYGPRENPQNEHLSALARFLDLLPVISAGNSADRPYILGGPSNTVEAISVAQTSVPNAFGFPLVVNAPPAIAGVYTNTNTVAWAPITTGFTGNVRRAGAAGTPAALACDLADTIDFTGMVALIDRGVCSVSIKVDNAANRGAIGVIIANNVAGDAPTFSFGGGTTFVQTLIVTQAIGNTLKTVPTDTANVTVGGGTAIPLAGSMASTSSRGPAYNASAIKPEIGAPGAMLSAEYGTGTGRTIFGGTSGAAPMVSGAAALLLEQFPGSTPTEIKARLMNAAQRNILTNPVTLPGELAPISRIGAGELRVDASAGLDAIAWDASNPAGVGLSFGTHRLGGPPTTFQRKVAVKNNTLSPQTFDIATDFRYANDQASGAVTFTHPPSITVPADSTAAFTLSMRVDPNLLPAWTASGLHLASNQGTGSRLQSVEYDGYVRLTGGGDTVTLPWHVLPHKASNIAVSGNPVNLGGNPSGTFGMSNVGGSVASSTDVFALTGTSPRQSPFALPYGGGVALTDLKAAGVRPVDVGQLGLQFAVATWGERSHPAYPAEFDILVDANDDGVDDYVVFTSELGAFGSDGRTGVFVQALGGATATAFFFVDADLNSSNAVLTVPASAVGITSAAQRFRFSVLAFDNRVSGMVTDSIGSMTHTAGTPRFQLPGGATLLSVPIGVAGAVPVESVPGGAAASPSQTGLLLLHRDAKTNRESDLLVVNP
jgi:subtilisin family serine protease